jgi:hypothetical protein
MNLARVQIKFGHLQPASQAAKAGTSVNIHAHRTPLSHDEADFRHHHPLMSVSFSVHAGPIFEQVPNRKKSPGIIGYFFLSLFMRLDQYAI